MERRGKVMKALKIVREISYFDTFEGFAGNLSWERMMS